MDNTAGVGTRSYASPEQLEGSDYDALTDIYSLGFILFELCYPMTTGMERHVCFSSLRHHQFPAEWNNGMATHFPKLHSMLCSMLSIDPAGRPSAEAIAQHMATLMGEFTVLSIESRGDTSVGLLRVEAEPTDGVLARTMKLITDTANGATAIEQYGLRGESNKTILEFALSQPTEEVMSKIVAALEASTDIKVVRQVSHGGHSDRQRASSISE